MCVQKRKYVNFRIDFVVGKCCALAFWEICARFPHKTFRFMAAIDWSKESVPQFSN